MGMLHEYETKQYKILKNITFYHWGKKITRNV